MGMSNRERLVAALNTKQVDRLPWSPLICNYFTSSLTSEKLNYNLLETARYLDMDFMERHVANPIAKITNVITRRENKNNGTRTYLDTPVGSIYIDNENMGKTSFVSKRLITSIEDVRIFKYIAEHTDYTPNIAEFVAQDNMIGDLGMATPTGNTSPVQELLQHIAGVENTVYLMNDYPDEMDELFEVMHDRNKRQYLALCEYPCCVVFDYEDTSTTVMSKNMFVKYSQPCINQYTEILHDADKLFITHMCGKLAGFADEIANGIQDGFDSICPPHTGDLYPWDARRIWGENKVLIGGIDPPELSRITERQALELTIEIIRKVDNKLGFILSTGDAVPYGTPIENLTIITKLIKELGSKSLTGDFDDTIINSILR